MTNTPDTILVDWPNPYVSDETARLLLTLNPEQAAAALSYARLCIASEAEELIRWSRHHRAGLARGGDGAHAHLTLLGIVSDELARRYTNR